VAERTPFERDAIGRPRELALLLIVRDPEHRETVLAAARVVGVTPIAASPSAVFSGERLVDIVVADIRGCDDDSAMALLAQIDAAAQRMPVRVIVAIEHAQIDLAYAGVHGAHVQYLIEPTIVDFATALVTAGSGPGNRVREDGREAERLRRLNAEVARIAEMLARLARDSVGADESMRSVRAPALEYRPSTAGPAPSPAVVRGAIRARRLRGQFFEPELFADPALDMLLDLYAAHLEGVRVSVSSLCIAAAVPGTTALRWISTMVDAGLFERQADIADRRRAFIALTGIADAAMAAYFAAVDAAGLNAA
jgi:hypothetical protein